jgi:Phage gp6-like head-tail connector protein
VIRDGSVFTVLTPAATHDLTTLEIVKEELNVLDDDSDSRLARWITQSSDYIERWCNRVFCQEVVSELWRTSYWGWGGYADHLGPHGGSSEPRPLLLRRYPIVQIESITDQGTVLDPSTYEVDAENGRVWRLTDDGSTRMHWWGTPLSVVYTGGWDGPDNMPPALQQACLDLIKIRQDTRNRDRLQRSQTIPGVLEEQWWNPATPGQPGMPPEVAEELLLFRNHNAP